jgi:hypothetical protein
VPTHLFAALQASLVDTAGAAPPPAEPDGGEVDQMAAVAHQLEAVAQLSQLQLQVELERQAATVQRLQAQLVGERDAREAAVEARAAVGGEAEVCRRPKPTVL